MSDAGLVLPVRGGTCTITDQQLEIWERRYRSLDVRAAVARAISWAEANPSRRKVNGLRFVVNWLNREQPGPARPRLERQLIPPPIADPWWYADCPHAEKCGNPRMCAELRQEA